MAIKSLEDLKDALGGTDPHKQKGVKDDSTPQGTVKIARAGIGYLDNTSEMEIGVPYQAKFHRKRPRPGADGKRRVKSRRQRQLERARMRRLIQVYVVIPLLIIGTIMEFKLLMPKRNPVPTFSTADFASLLTVTRVETVGNSVYLVTADMWDSEGSKRQLRRALAEIGKLVSAKGIEVVAVTTEGGDLIAQNVKGNVIIRRNRSGET